MLSRQPDPWGFDEAPVETWADILGPQYLDLALLAAFLVLALVSFQRKSVPLKFVTFAAAIGYMGFAKSYLISITNIFSVHRLELAGLQVQPGLVPVLRLHGGLDGAVGPALLRPHLRLRRADADARRDAAGDAGASTCRGRSRSARRWIKFGMLAGVLALLPGHAQPADLPVRRAVLDVRPVRHAGDVDRCWRVLLAATRVRPQLYCRFLCPVGATLGLMSYLTVFRIKRWSECNTCRICQKACEWGAIEGPKILVTECVRCDDCERLYADTAKCPHWRIIEYNNRKIAILPLQPVSRGRSPEVANSS